jgi:hypothetical protein
MRPIVLSTTLAAGSANAIALAQARGSAGALTLNGALVTSGVATLSPARRVIVTTIGDSSGITWTVVGTDREGSALTETFAGGGAGVAAVSTQDFLTVTSITASAAATGNVTAGTNSQASSAWAILDRFPTDWSVGLACNVLSGSPTWDIEFTYDNLWNLPSGATFARVVTFATMQGLTMAAQGALPFPVFAVRHKLTVVGGVQTTVNQQGQV